MPIETRPPTDRQAGTPPTDAMRRGGQSSISMLPPPSAGLLPPDGSHVPAPAPAPSRALALDALRLIRGRHDPRQGPAAWFDAAFGREVELIRRHLNPLRTRRALASSYSREAFHVLADPLDPPGPARVAYAIRWLELGSGERRPRWDVFFDDPG